MNDISALDFIFLKNNAFLDEKEQLEDRHGETISIEEISIWMKEYAEIMARKMKEQIIKNLQEEDYYADEGEQYPDYKIINIIKKTDITNIIR